MNIPTKINSGRQPLDQWLEKNYPEYYQLLKQTMNEQHVDIRVAEYMYKNNLKNIPVCPVCGNPVKFYGPKYGFAKFCCPKCAQLDKETRQKQVDTLKQRYGKNYKESIIQKSKKTLLDRYGVDNPAKDPNLIIKSQKTCLDRYGVDNPMKFKKFQEKSKKTCLKKYGAEYWFLSDKYSMQRSEALEKTKKTNLQKYGVPSATQNEDVKLKISQTVANKYGVSWSCMREEAHNSRNSKSKPNLMFESRLKGISQYKKEFPVENLIYDFKVGNNLIEINPTATHNINWSPFGKEKDKNYHLRKTNVAKNNGYKCIHVWDWDDMDKIINLLKPKQTIYARQCSIKNIKYKTAKKFLEENHLQGNCRGQKAILGLYYKNSLVELMSFGKSRYDKNVEWELLRLCTNAGYIVVGGASKLFNYFINTFQPNTIVSYCDNSKFTGAVYNQLGFDLINITQPGIHWYNPKTKDHVLNSMLLSLGADRILHTNYGKGSSNEQIMFNNGFVQVCDCGQMKFIWKTNGAKEIEV